MMDGVIADFEVAEAMLGYFVRKAHARRRFVRPRAIIGEPAVSHKSRRGRFWNQPG
jgi:rod shape-determining protein MreB